MKEGWVVKGERAAEGEGTADVGRLFRDGKADLGAGAADAAEDIRAQLGAQSGGELERDDLRLIIAAPPLPRPMERHGDDDVHVGELRRGGQAFAQHAGEVPPGRQPALVLQVPGYMTVIRDRTVEKQCRGKRIRFVPAGCAIGRSGVRLAIQAQNRGVCA